MDPSELRMNLASLQRIDPFIKEILMSSPQVALYKYEGTEWEKTNIEGTLFVYARKCEPTYGFLILNRLSTTNLIQPVTPDIELQDKTPFLLYKTKEILGIWFYEQANCNKLFTTITQIIERLKSSGQGSEPNKHAPSSTVSVTAGPRNDGSINLADMLNNAGNKGRPPAAATAAKASPSSSGEKLLRLLSNQNQSEPEMSKKGDSVAAFFAQVSSNNPVIGPPPGMMMAPPLQINQPPMTALQNLLSNPGVMSVESLEKPMPPLPPQAKAASELESDLKPKMAPLGGKKTTPKENTKPASGKAKKASEPVKVNGSSASYASVLAHPTAAAVAAPTEQPQLLSPMVFAGQSQPPPINLTPGGSIPQQHPHFQPSKLACVMSPVNGGVPPMPQQQHPPVLRPGITPLTEDQLLQAFQHLLRTDRSLISKLHHAYVESLNTHLQ